MAQGDALVGLCDVGHSTGLGVRQTGPHVGSFHIFSGFFLFWGNVTFFATPWLRDGLEGGSGRLHVRHVHDGG